jgi:hypothetical protein
MTSQQDNFIRDYLKQLINGNAAIFAGAGLSVGAGYVDWRGLLREIAQDIELEIDKESDLLSIAQFHVNERGGRGKLNQKIIEEFTEKAELTDNHKILASLPIRTFWTTNYDSLLEDALEDATKRVDVKHTVSQLPNTTYKRDAVVYKMHGDAKHPQQATLTKDDYEQYHRKNEGFITSLSSDLVSKTFLFLGFSFTDPNLDYVLSRVKLFLDGNTRPHYCIIRKVVRGNFETDADYDYAVRRQNLMISDLKRFQIQAVIVNEYSEITEILTEIQKRFKRNTIFISGSAAVYDPHNEQESLEFIHGLSRDLIKKNYAVVNGFGLGIGDAVINGALEAIYSSPKKYNEDQLIMRPFPQKPTGAKTLPDLWYEYRQRMISFSGIAIFVFGNKKKNGEIVSADGVEKEFNIAISQGVIPIPVGVTGSISHKLWENVRDNYLSLFTNWPEAEKLYLSLSDEQQTLKQHATTVVKIINLINGK